MFNPSNKIWLNIVLVFFLIIEVIFLASTLIGFFKDIISIEYLLLGLFGLLVYHFLMMLSLNRLFNIQSIKENIKELKDKICNRNDWFLHPIYEINNSHTNNI